MLDYIRRRTGVWIAVAALILTSTTVSPGPDDNIPPDDPTYFQFARVKFNESGRFFWAGWAHDYPRAERNLLKILAEVTGIKTTPDSYTIVELDDPRIMEFPLLYFSEPGTWADHSTRGGEPPRVLHAGRLYHLR